MSMRGIVRPQSAKHFRLSFDSLSSRSGSVYHRAVRSPAQRQGAISTVSAIVAVTACVRRSEPPRASLVPLIDLEDTFGNLITAGNHPIPDQNGTGDRLGLFLELMEPFGAYRSRLCPQARCWLAPPALHGAAVTDRYSAGATVVGATDEPTNWPESLNWCCVAPILARGQRCPVGAGPRLLGAGITRAAPTTAVLSACSPDGRELVEFS